MCSKANAAETELVCVDPARIHEIWLHVRELLRTASERTALSAFAEIEADILSGRSLVWIVWNGRTIEAASATALINSDIGKVCVITLCAGRGMQRWLKLIERLEAYAKDEGCTCIRIFGRRGWLRVLEGYESKHIVIDRRLA